MVGPQVASWALTLVMAGCVMWGVALAWSTRQVSREAARLADHVIAELERAQRSDCQPGRGSADSGSRLQMRGPSAPGV